MIREYKRVHFLIQSLAKIHVRNLLDVTVHCNKIVDKLILLMVGSCGQGDRELDSRSEGLDFDS